MVADPASGLNEAILRNHRSRLKLFVMLELLYLVIIFILMVLMRFGIE